jgi:hypothetical protein
LNDYSEEKDLATLTHFVDKLGIAELYRWYYEYIQQFANPSFSFSYLLNPTAAGQTYLTTVK